jgi:S-adenosylmethionine synthetase
MFTGISIGAGDETLQAKKVCRGQSPRVIYLVSEHDQGTTLQGFFFGYAASYTQGGLPSEVAGTDVIGPMR